MRPPKQKQPQVKKGLCRVLEHVDVDVDEVACEQALRGTGVGSRLFNFKTVELITEVSLFLSAFHHFSSFYF